MDTTMGTRGARLHTVLVCVALALVAFARSAEAEPASEVLAGLELRWTAPASCPQQAQVRDRLARQLRSPPPPDALVRVTITAKGDHFELALRTRSRQGVGERTLSHPKCDELASAAIALVAWTFDGDSQASPEAAPAEPLAVKEETRSEPSGAASRPEFAAGVVGAVSTGQFGLVAPGVGLGGRLMGSNFGGRLLLAHWLQRAQAAPDGVSEGRVRLWTSTLSGCWRANARSSWDVCLLVEGGVANARGAGQLEPAESVSAPWWATGVSGSWLLFRDAQFRVPLELAGLYPLRDSSFVLESSNPNVRADTLFQTRLELRLNVGIELH